MPTIVAVVPALAIEEPVQLADFVLVPASKLEEYDCDARDLAAYRDIIAAYERLQRARAATQAVLLQINASSPDGVSLHGANAALDCLAFSATCAGRKHMIDNPGWPVLAYPDHFHASPMAPGRRGGFIYETSWAIGYSTVASGLPLYWPVGEQNNPRGIKWDENLRLALAPVVRRIVRRPNDAEARRLSNAISLMNFATAGSADLLPGHADMARPLVLAVAAIETLCHTGTGQINQEGVVATVDRLTFKLERLTRRTNKWTNLKGSLCARTSPVGLVMRGAYEARHVLVHGERFGTAILHYRRKNQRTLLIRPLFFIFRKLVIAAAAPFKGLPETAPSLAGKPSPARIRRFGNYMRILREEDAYDECLARLLIEKRPK